MKIGVCLTIIPEWVYHFGDGGVQSEMVVLDIPEKL